MAFIKYIFITLTLLVMNAYLLNSVDKGVCEDNSCLHRSLQKDIESILLSKAINFSEKINESFVDFKLDELNKTYNDSFDLVRIENNSSYSNDRDKSSNKKIKNVDQVNVLDNHSNSIGNTTNYNVNEEDIVKVLSARMLQSTYPFVPSKAKDASNLCRIHTRKFLTYLEKMELWALKMHDSSAKISSGILNGNVNQFGDFDECLSVEEPNQQFKGQYCLVYLQPEINQKSKLLKNLNKLIQSYGMFKSNFNDPGHRVPRFSTVNWGVCVPSSCTYLEVESAMTEYMKNFTEGTGVSMKVRVDKEMCQVKENQWTNKLDKSTIIASAFFLIYFGLLISASLYEYYKTDNKNVWIVAFSLIKNTKNILNLKREPNDIACIHGIRAVNAYLLIISHKSMALFFNPYINRTSMAETVGQPWTVIARAASLYTDPFIMMSGLLTTYSLFGRLQKGHHIKIFQEYIGRFLRIAPPLGALILFCTYILPLLGSGPQWNLVITHHSGICKMYWWRNLMFIHNYFGFENMCLTHTHHIGIDTQLFLTAPIFTYLLWKWPKKTFLSLVTLASISTGARYYVTVTKNLSNYVFFGTSVSQLFDTADFMYILPAHRLTVYIMGVLLGYFLRIYKHKQLTNAQLRIGWWASVILLLISFFGPAPMGSINYQYNSTHAAIYAALSPIGWCCFFAWVIFTSHLGYNESKFHLKLPILKFVKCKRFTLILYLL
uniref:CSON009625 protein n=1 Tax=Culicoides sonorensis TaxID=179676 RepID=A0A336N027_CULSO